MTLNHYQQWALDIQAVIYPYSRIPAWVIRRERLIIDARIKALSSICETPVKWSSGRSVRRVSAPKGWWP